MGRLKEHFHEKITNQQQLSAGSKIVLNVLIRLSLDNEKDSFTTFYLLPSLRHSLEDIYDELDK